MEVEYNRQTRLVSFHFQQSGLIPLELVLLADYDLVGRTLERDEGIEHARCYYSSLVAVLPLLLSQGTLAERRGWLLCPPQEFRAYTIWALHWGWRPKCCGVTRTGLVRVQTGIQWDEAALHAFLCRLECSTLAQDASRLTGCLEKGREQFCRILAIALREIERDMWKIVTTSQQNAVTAPLWSTRCDYGHITQHSIHIDIVNALVSAGIWRDNFTPLLEHSGDIISRRCSAAGLPRFAMGFLRQLGIKPSPPPFFNLRETFLAQV
nr:MAG: viral suppressor of RNA silencing [Plant associated polerovirus 3]